MLVRVVFCVFSSFVIFSLRKRELVVFSGCLLGIVWLLVCLSLLRVAVGCIGVVPNAQLRTCVIKIVTLKGGHLMW